MDAHQPEIDADPFESLSPAAKAWYVEQRGRLYDRFGPDAKAIAKGMSALTFPHDLAKLQGLPHDPLAAEVSEAAQLVGFIAMVREMDAVDRLLPGASDEVKMAYLDLINDEEG